MLKYAIIAGTMALSVPAVAQNQPMGSQATPMSQAAPAQTAPTPADPAQAQPAMPGAPTTAQDAAQPAPAQAAAQPADKAAQVAQVVEAEFPSYDKDSNGSLNKTEFAAWMVALRKASDPTIKAEAPATKKWIGDAFAQADTDKNKSISKTELEGFLSKGQS